MWEKLLFTEVVVPRSDMRAFTVLIIVIQFMWVPFLLFNALRNAEFMGRKLQIVVGWVVTLWIKEVFISIDHCRGKTFVFKNSKLTSQSLRIIAGFLREAEIVVCLNEVSHYQILTVLLSDFRQQLKIKRKKNLFMVFSWNFFEFQMRCNHIAGTITLCRHTSSFTETGSVMVKSPMCSTMRSHIFR